MDWRAWVQMLGAAIGVVDPAAGVLVGEVTAAITTISGDTDEEKALIKKWQDWCTAVIKHGGPPTPEERAEAKKFADDVFSANEALK